MNIADKIGLYLLLSIVFTLAGGIVGQTLPGTDVTSIIIFTLATIGILILFAAIGDILIWCITRIGELAVKEYNGRFVEVIHATKLTFYSVFYVSLYPLLGDGIYVSGGTIYAESTELMVSLYDFLANIFRCMDILFIVIVLISALLYYWNEPIVQKE